MRTGPPFLLLNWVQPCALTFPQASVLFLRGFSKHSTTNSHQPEDFSPLGACTCQLTLVQAEFYILNWTSLGPHCV